MIGAALAAAARGGGDRMNALRRCFNRKTVARAGAAVLLVSGLSGAAQAQTRDQLFNAYLAELHGSATEYVALGLHYRHDVDCTSRGCVLMGPTDNRDACEEWVKHYNRIDPYDVARCVEAGPFFRGQ